jgi:microcystin-dependent protein
MSAQSFLYIGEIQIFAIDFIPDNFLPCDGTSYYISTYPALFARIGTTYGGDGKITFAVPDLRDRVAIHHGTGPGFTPRAIGESGGESAVTLQPGHLPAHSHAWNANQTAPVATGGGNTLGAALTYGTPVGATLVSLDLSTIGAEGGSQPHDNEQPTLSLTFAIRHDE